MLWLCDVSRVHSIATVLIIPALTWSINLQDKKKKDEKIVLIILKGYSQGTKQELLLRVSEIKGKESISAKTWEKVDNGD